MFTYVVRTNHPDGFDTRSSDTMHYTHALVTTDGNAFSWHQSEGNARKASQASRVAHLQLQVVPAERHDGGKAKVERALRAELAAKATEAKGTSAAAERRTEVTATVPTTAQLQQLLPGQAFTWPPTGQVLRMVKCGKASFRAERPEGDVATFKGSPTRVVEVGDPAMAAALDAELAEGATADVVPLRKADRTEGRTARGRKVPTGKSGDPRTDKAEQAQPVGSTAKGWAKGDSYTLQDDTVGTVAWVRAAYLLVKLPKGTSLAWRVVLLADLTEYAEATGGAAEAKGRQLAK